MDLYLEQLPHQQAAIAAVLQAMRGCRDFDDFRHPDYKNAYANPLIQLQSSSLNAIKLPESLGGSGIDVKMETGTGKTYVYTRLMYELNQQFGLNKFIIFVPSLAIKEGTKSFIKADYAKQHFSEVYGNTKIDLDVIDAGSFSIKNGRKTMSSELVDYLEGSRNERNTIKALLLNDAMLTSKSMTRNDYDQTLIGSTSCPVEGLKLTRPIVIIDEPHRFKKGGKAFRAIKDLQPQLIIRFGATFPEVSQGHGRSKAAAKDYENLVYNLGSVEAFNNGLVKAVDIHFPEIGEKEIAETTRYKVVEIKSVGSKYVRFKRIGSDKTYDIKVNDSLSVIDESFEGDVELAEIKNADLAVLSNDLELHKGSILIPDIFSASYQELMVKQAIDKHFIKERENWFRTNNVNAPRIKTLSLFFIDSIPSYRDDDGWLKQVFEKLLSEKLKTEIAREPDEEYKDFLEQSLARIGETHGGYFAEDNGIGDEAVQKEVDDILRNKSKLLMFKQNAQWSLRRFLFSKWTLREGWDNPNVFVITKLRTSGSESSKIQEVGRGLRLPVDENGKRLSSTEFRLDYIIDWSERDFADKLVGEINTDSGVLEKVTPSIYEKLIEVGFGPNEKKVKARLLIEDIIDENDKIIDIDKLLAILPADAVPMVRKSKVTSNGSNKTARIKLRKENWDKIKDSWKDVTKRYMIQFERVNDNEIEKIVEKVIVDKNFVIPRIGIRTLRLSANDDDVSVEEAVDMSEKTSGRSIDYGDFLRRLAKRTSVSARMWHSIIKSRFGDGLNKQTLNFQTIERITSHFRGEFEVLFAEKYSYTPLNYMTSTSVIKNDSFVDDIEQGLVGINRASDVVAPDNYLYDSVAYDSEIEHEVLKIRPAEKIIVYGKLPRRSVKVPTYMGGTTTPDFIYGIDKGNGYVELNLLVETKAKDIRMSEQTATSAQDKLFSGIKNITWRKVVEPGEVSEIVDSL